MMILESTLNNVANRTADVFLIWEIPDTSPVFRVPSRQHSAVWPNGATPVSYKQT